VKSVSCCLFTGRGLCEELITVQSNSTDCDVSESDREASKRRPRFTRVVYP
jgi:hypothetical protein